MNQKNRITYRFDRAGNAISENSRNVEHIQEPGAGKAPAEAAKKADAVKPAKHNVIPLYPANDQHSLQEIGPWDSPFQEDIGALEQLIRETDAEPPAPRPDEDDSRKRKEKIPAAINISSKPNDGQPEFDTIDDAADGPVPPAVYISEMDEELPFDEARPRRGQYTRINRSPKGPSWFNVFLSVTGALATGALFGYLLLSLFTGASLWPEGGAAGQDPQPAATSPSVQPSAGDETGQSNGGSTAGNSGKEQQTTAALSGLDQTYYMLQFGVFSNTAGRDAALAQLNGEGLAAAALTGENDYRVYAGMASDREKAQTVRTQLQDLQLYIKEVSVAAPEAIPYNGKAEEAQTFFTQTKDLVRMLDELSLAQLEQASLSPLGQSAAESWKAEFAKWTKSADTLRIGITDKEGKAFSEPLIQSVQAAAKAMQDYDKKPARAQLWTVQTSLMEAVLTQKEWFETISAL
ncbi:SPOR domain-containing protein [Paenibacillus sp. N4]|uniref:SPOR domain-containing protein n=1 Tax=Paenibacillus vietnamensis TaxID=2590547 RepID=UPI001CD16133|nr:SPOR domain-containing protein [Paenibacillus vietnamensis]MCA0755279.1 SPOR domain-containing protein [Paenibacillus vietnamensis]